MAIHPPPSSPLLLLLPVLVIVFPSLCLAIFPVVLSPSIGWQALALLLLLVLLVLVFGGDFGFVTWLVRRGKVAYDAEVSRRRGKEEPVLCSRLLIQYSNPLYTLPCRSPCPLLAACSSGGVRFSRQEGEWRDVGEGHYVVRFGALFADFDHNRGHFYLGGFLLVKELLVGE